MDARRIQVCLGQVIREKRRGLGYSQESFAEIVELHRTYVGSVERGERNVSLLNLVKIATALGVHLSTLIAETEAVCAK